MGLAVALAGAPLDLSCLTAGVAKLASPVWRRGRALPGVLGTQTYGHPAAAAAVARHARLALASAWAVTAFEVSCPALLLGSPWLGLGALGVGLTFHLACAAAMVPNNVLLGFPAAYPCALAARFAAG